MAKNKESQGMKAQAPAPLKTKSAPKEKKPGIFARLKNYFRDVRLEMKRVVWPTQSELINSSIVVVVTLIFFIIFILIAGSIIEPVLTGFAHLAKYVK